MAGERLVDWLASRNRDLTRDQCLSHILCGDVVVNAGVIRDPRFCVAPNDQIEISASRFVGRGGEKLEAAMAEWGIDVVGKVFVDAGSSTGGFTDCLLQRGARTVHAVDVGHNQLAYKLRTDERVRVHEQTNIVDVTVLDPVPNAAVADLSFRSLRGVARRILDLTTDRWAVFLIKPQFEWGTPTEDFRGVVPPGELSGILERVLTDLLAEGVAPTRLMQSPVPGRRGNLEYLVRVEEQGAGSGPEIRELVRSVL